MEGFIKNPGKQCPAEKANFVSKLFFAWPRKLFVTGAKRELTMEDMFYPLKNDQSQVIRARLERAWDRQLDKLKTLEYLPGEKKKKKKKIFDSSEPSLWRALLSVFWSDYLFSGILHFLLMVGLKSFQPMLQKGIIDYFDAGGSAVKTSENLALVYVTGLILNSLICIFLNHHSYLSGYQVAMRARVGCSALIYKKVLKLSKSALDDTTPGQIINLLSNDLMRLDVVGLALHKFWIVIVQLFVMGWLIYILIGPAAFVGLGVLIMLVAPLQFTVNRYMKRLRRRIAVYSDKRIQKMGELVNGIQVVKMYAWEATFARIVAYIRNVELKGIRRANYLRALTISVAMCTDKIILFSTLLAYVIYGNALTPDVTFTVALYFGILQSSCSISFPLAILQTGEMYVSLKRVQEFLLLDEVSGAKMLLDEVKKSRNKEEEKKEEESVEANLEGISSSSDSEKLPKIRESSEREEEEVASRPEAGTSRSPSVEMERLSANWKSGRLPSTLCDVSLRIFGGELCAVVGKVGSGKSSLLSVLLQELPIGSGKLHIRRQVETESDDSKDSYVVDDPNLVISYASQAAWLFTGTVRDNIVFGQAWDAQKYREVTKVCALWRDMRQWPQGDMTIVGDRGIVLSGGQKARVNLARAIYKDADIYLLDDPLSAVDPRVGQHLFKKCIGGYLKGKTRIFVTHQLQYLKLVDTIVILDRGIVRGQGTFEDLKQSNSAFIELLSQYESSQKEKEKKSSDVVDDAKNDVAKHGRANIEKQNSIGSMDSFNSSMDWSGNFFSGNMNSCNPDEVLRGTLSWDAWKRFFRAGNSILFIIILIMMMIIAQVMLTGIDFWISYWSDLESIRQGITDPSLRVSISEFDSYVNNTVFSNFGILDEWGLLDRVWAVNIYTILIICCIVIILGRNFITIIVYIRSSRKLHDEMFFKVLHATMRFFNANQSGRILNRFSKDVGAMDELLPLAFIDGSRIMLLMVGIFATIVIMNPWTAIPMIALFVIFFFITRIYLRTSYSIRRLEGAAKSPLFTQVNATIQGLATIRSSGSMVMETLRKQYDQYLDIHSGTWYMCQVATAVLSLWLDIFSWIFVNFVCYSMVLIKGEILGGSAGLVINQSLQLTGLLQYGIRQCIETCNYMTAVERILDFTDVKSENSSVPKDPAPQDWPSKGRLTMRNVTMSYANDNLPALKGLNVAIEAGWKVGVVGRTGAGKSSLIAAIFRLENEGLDGEIRIDGRDTGSVELEELRSRISITPQEPVLFSGTLRYNLDPFDSYDDAVLWDALRDVELNNLSFDHPVAEGGSNFSVGERQLICLARAILKNNRILVLDEATANIDAKTDSIIQKAVKTKFGKHTVITVAHRLITIIDNDRVLVMDDGQISEFGCPYELLCNNPNGPFSQMVRQTGPTTAETLKKLAKNACNRVPVQHSLDLTSTKSWDSITTKDD